MNDRFVPLATKVSAGNTGESFRVKILSNVNGDAVPFHPLGTSPGISSAHVAHGELAEKSRVSLVREGERITGIRVQCACGEVIELQCVY